MAFIADILLAAGAAAAAFYCFILSRRLRRFTDLEKGVGGAIEQLDGSDVIAERPMPHQLVHGGLVVDDDMGLLHVEVGEEMPNAIPAIEWAAHDVIQAQPALSIVDDFPQRGGKIGLGIAQTDAGFHGRPSRRDLLLAKIVSIG